MLVYLRRLVCSFWHPVAVGVAVVVLSLAAACSRPTTVAPSATLTVAPEPATPEPSPTDPPPTATLEPTSTPEPLALTVNGWDVNVAAYEREMARCQAGLSSAGADPAACDSSVAQAFVEGIIVEQAALAAGLAVSEADVDAALASITTELGGAGALDSWLQANFYSPEEFRAALAADLLRARLVAQIAGQVGDTADQVHARAILVLALDTAQSVLGQVQSGADFATLALTYSRDLTSRAAGGDLGWFPRGTLTVPEVEAAAFSLEPGQTSDVIESQMGFHIVQVIERDPARALSPAAAQALQAAAFDSWLAARLAEAQVTRYVEP